MAFLINEAYGEEDYADYGFKLPDYSNTPSRLKITERNFKEALIEQLYNVTDIVEHLKQDYPADDILKLIREYANDPQVPDECKVWDGNYREVDQDGLVIRGLEKYFEVLKRVNDTLVDGFESWKDLIKFSKVGQRMAFELANDKETIDNLKDYAEKAGIIKAISGWFCNNGPRVIHVLGTMIIMLYPESIPQGKSIVHGTSLEFAFKDSAVQPERQYIRGPYEYQTLLASLENARGALPENMQRYYFLIQRVGEMRRDISYAYQHPTIQINRRKCPDLYNKFLDHLAYNTAEEAERDCLSDIEDLHRNDHIRALFPRRTTDFTTYKYLIIKSLTQDQKNRFDNYEALKPKKGALERKAIVKKGEKVFEPMMIEADDTQATPQVEDHVKFQKVKFNDEQIFQLFNTLNEDLYKKGLGSHILDPLSRRSKYWNPNTGLYDIPAVVKFREMADEGEIDGIDINAVGMIDAGTSYDSQTEEQRESNAKKRVLDVIAAINDLLQTSADPLFSRLQCTLKSKNLRVCYTKKDQYDDGYDLFGMQFYMKFSYKS